MPSARLRAAIVALLAPLAASLPAAATTIERVVSPGGIEAWLVENHTVPLMAMSFAFEGGASQDPEGKEGLANLVTTLLDEGAGDMDSAAFQGALDDLSVDLGFDAGRDRFYGSFRTLSSERESAIKLLRLALSEPRFDADAIERMRAQVISGLRRAERDPEEIASRTFSRIAFAGHPYGRPVEGTSQTVQAITVDDIRAFHKAVFSRTGLKIAVVGDIDAATLAPLLDEAFGALPQENAVRRVPEVVPKSGAREHVAIPLPQTVARFGLPGIKRHDPDFVAGYVVNHILGGGGFSSRLYREVREKRGLAYSVWTALLPYEHAGAILGGVATRAGRMADSLSIIRGEIRRMAEEGPTEQELQEAKSYLTGSYALRFDTSTKIASQLLQIQLDDLGIDYIDRRNDMIRAVTLEDARRVAKRLYSDDLSVVTVGPDGS